LNLTLRRSVSYRARRSPGYARCPHRLTHQLELARCHYNFLRPHASDCRRAKPLGSELP
jgi:hypothetical protein